MIFALAELAARVGGEAIGDGDLRLSGVGALEDATAEQVSFFANKKYRRAFEASKAGVVVVAPEVPVPPGRAVLRVANPYLAFAKIATLFHPPREPEAGVAAGAVVHPTARVHASAQVMALASVGAGAVVGERTILHPGAHLGDGAQVGADCLLYQNVVVRERCILGDRVILQPGCVVGGDGFGFALDLEGDGKGPRHYKFPQVGIVVIEDDVELGANTCVDRAALGVTRVGRGAKIDNLVQLAHNVEVGPLSILAAQVGVSGSTKLGMGVVAWGQSGITGHLTIGDRVTINAQAGVHTDLASGASVAGSPCTADVAWARNAAAFNRLTEMRRELRHLRDELAALKAARDEGDEP